MDRAADANRPGGRVFQRLNRAEYQRAVRDLLALDIDVSGLLPADTISAGFDNVADSQMFSPTLMEAYLRAASKVTSLAIGDPEAESAEALYRVPKTSSQMERVDGAPLGTRGGHSVVHTFPADGDYSLRLELHGNACGFLFGGPSTGEQMEVSIDGERVALLDVNPRMADMSGGMSLKTPPIHISAGAHRVTAAFLQRFEGPGQRPDRADRSHPGRHPDRRVVRRHHAAAPEGHGDRRADAGDRRVRHTDSRRKIFACRPDRARRRAGVRVAHRPRPGDAGVPPPGGDARLRSADDVLRRRAAPTATSSTASPSALEAILASPQFLFRLEPVPATAVAGRPYRLDDLALASRLSFFIWGSGPDAALLKAATRRARCRRPGALDRQVKRMLADPRSDALAIALCRAVAAPRRRRADPAGRHPLSVLRPVARPRDGARRRSSSSTAWSARIAACSTC